MDPFSSIRTKIKSNFMSTVPIHSKCYLMTEFVLLFIFVITQLEICNITAFLVSITFLFFLFIYTEKYPQADKTVGVLVVKRITL